MSSCKLLIAGTLIFIFASIAVGQSGGAESSSQPSSSQSSASAAKAPGEDRPWGAESVTVLAGYSPASNHGVGKMLDRKLFVAQARFAWILWRPKSMTLRYFAELTPAAIITQPAEDYKLPDGSIVRAADAHTNFGMGGSPVGLQLNFCRGKKLQPFIASNIGALYFNRQTPVVDSQQFNFTFTFTAGLQIYKSSKGSWQMGYSLHHISNADAGRYNPGVDSNLIWLGYAFGGRR